MALRLELFLIWAGVSMFLQLDPVNGDDNCVFPFIYGNKKHFDCTYQGAIYPWCSLDADYRGRWKYCTNKDYAKCVFPFIYEGKSYDTCTTVGSFASTYWCSLSPDYDQDGVWKYC
ncbi:unnamed protein product [Rangifer tarandus platyrhynchus]|uniref:Uncharacterized protein n=2 Tax=Rangifer tarandus platyrhynchus TaxID=3082113 RepID=A0ACB0EAK0_RANTA|nr:unnamed protein product [Rangifer tarandus platyrhynchus]CAI9697497.1 unnamed protein product [Rangifer tarandus platyrhynchus]